MNNEAEKIIIDELLGAIDIPAGAYDRTKRRYKDLGDWFGRQGGRVAGCAPHIYSQGSFRLGTVVRPLNEKDDYDLDVGCRLKQNISKTAFTQKDLKGLIGLELEDYRRERKIEKPLDEKNRCWRLQYKDEMSFHMDVVPSIPEDAPGRQIIKERMIQAGSNEALAQAVAALTGAITDKKHPQYSVITQDWRNSNSEGYALWFESRVKLATGLQKRILSEARAAQIDPLPMPEWKSPLQQSIKILKRHRDLMFQKNQDGQPISIIITTLAAAAYQGEEGVRDAMRGILSKMGSMVRDKAPRVPNPVNPEEDFADKWPTPEGQRLKLEKNFRAWLKAAQMDFGVFATSDDAQYLTEQVRTRFGAILNTKELERKLAPFAVNIAVSGADLAARKPSSPVDLRGGGRNG